MIGQTLIDMRGRKPAWEGIAYRSEEFISTIRRYYRDSRTDIQEFGDSRIQNKISKIKQKQRLRKCH